MVPPAPARPDAPPTEAIVAAARALDGASSLEALSRPFLDLLHAVTGLQSTYLTEYRSEHDDQIIRYADNRGRLEIAEGVTVDWSRSLCKRAYESRTYATSDAAKTFPDCPIPAEMGITTFLSVPVLDSGDELVGTLCSASDVSEPIPAGAVEVMRLLAQLIGDQWERDRQHDAMAERAASAERRLLDRATFLAEAEHKLKSPLTVIRGWTELLAEDWPGMDDAERDEAFTIMRRATRDASRQVQQLLDEARGEVLSLQLELVPVPLHEVIAEIGRQLQGASSEAHRVTARGGDPVHVLADRQALWQVLWHLGENAVKYSPDGGRIDLRYVVAGQGKVIITLTDEGLGLPEGVDLFEPFTRGDDRIAGIPGTGLGLHIVRNLVHAMSGTVSAATRERGSRFTVVLPIVQG